MGIITKIYKKKVEEEQKYRDKALRMAKKIAFILVKRFGAKKLFYLAAFLKMMFLMLLRISI